MLKQLILVWLVVAVAIGVTAWLAPSVEIDGGVLALLGVAAIFGLVNALVGPVLHLISLPLTVITFGLFALVINAVLLAITAGLSDALEVGGFFSVLVAALIISIISTVVGMIAMRLFAEPEPA